MTSPFTHADTLAYFEQHAYFGLRKEQVHFFQQGFMPCFTEQGEGIGACHASQSRVGAAYLECCSLPLSCLNITHNAAPPHIPALPPGICLNLSGICLGFVWICLGFVLLCLELI